MARALRVPVDEGAARALRRARATPDATLAGFAEGVRDAAGQLRLTVLARAMPAGSARECLTSGSLPVVFVRRTADGDEALVVTAVARDKVTATRIGADLDEHRVTLALDALLTQWHRDDVPLLVPLAVAPDGAHAWDGADHEVSPLERLWRLLREERRLVGSVYLYAGLAGLFSLTLPLGVQAIIGLVSGGMILQPVVLLIAFVILGTLANGGLQLLQLSVVEAVQQRLFARLAFDLTGRLARARLDRLASVDLPELMNRFFEIKTIQKSLGKLLTDWVTAGLQVLSGLLLLTFYHPYFSLFGALLLATLALIFRVTAPRGWQTSLGESKYKYRVAHWLEELARTVRSLRFAGDSALPADRMDAVVGGYLEYRQAHFRVLVRQSVAFIAFRTLITAGLLILGSLLVVNRQITLGQFVASELVIVTVLLAVEKLIFGLADVYDLLTALEKAGHAAGLEPEPRQGVAPRPDADPRGMAVELRDASFTFPGRDVPAVRDVSLTVAPGERLGVTGPHGSGESSLVAMVGALYPAYTGAIAYDGLSLRDLDPVRLRGTIGYCGMEPALLDGTIEENIALGRPAVRTEHVLEAASRVGLDAWLHRLPDGIQTSLEVAGRALPQSLARRLVIARAIAGRPRLLLVDGFLDALDPSDRQEMADLLLDREAPWTLVLVTHHRALLERCDRVAVLEEGRVADVGPFPQVESTNAYLRQLVGSHA